MKRPWQVWLMFAVCVVGAATGMAWLTQQALQADRLRRAAEADAELEQRVSLALWRMDTALAPIIAEEVIRPASAYRPAETAVPPPPYVLLQFEAREEGVWWSPQVPTTQSYLPGRLGELSGAVDIARLLAELPDTLLPTAAEVGRNVAPANAAPTPDDPFQFFAGNRANFPAELQRPAAEQASAAERAIGKATQISKAADFEQRGQRYQSAAQQNLKNFDPQRRDGVDGGEIEGEQVGISRPIWVGERLLLARRMSENGVTHVQGCWLDWPALKARLLAEAEALLPEADLAPLNGAIETDPGRMLAGLPVRLVVGESVVPGAVGPELRWSLWMGWTAVLLATGAAAVLLAGVMLLSERRGAFVSSVTHELRTPLTTFRMYAELLARGMVPDDQRRQTYYETLQREAERMTLLVENVLMYARLERGRRPQARDRLTLAELTGRIGPRLAHRAEQAGMQCDVGLDEAAAQTELATDAAVVEQVLFNLVDNAAKYASRAADRRIHVEASRAGRYVRLAVRDHGPGIEERAWRRPMRAFGKSAEDAAESAPGVGLGLALCRRLAHELGGRLEIEAGGGGGATVALLLPAR